MGPLPRAFHGAARLGTENFVIYGGENGTNRNQKLNDAWAFSIQTLQWSKLGEMPIAGRSGFIIHGWKSHSGNIRLFIAGGTCQEGYCRDCYSCKLKNMQESIVEGESLLESKVGRAAEKPAEAPKQNTAVSAISPGNDDLSLNDLRKGQNIFQQSQTQRSQKLSRVELEKSQHKFMEELKSEVISDDEKSFANEPVKYAQNQCDEREINELKSEMQFKLQVLDAKIEQVRVQEENIKNLKRQLDDLTDKGSFQQNGYSFKELNDLKQNISTNLTRQLNQQIC